jgi:hypothetical protein
MSKALEDKGSDDWLAILVQIGGAPQFQVLASPAQVSSDLFLRRADRWLYTPASAHLPRYGTVPSTRFGQPIVVTGHTRCEAWWIDGVSIAARRLRVVAALLSLSWGGTWTVHYGPGLPTDEDFRPFEDGTGVRWSDDGIQGSIVADVTVPAWLSEAEQILSNDKGLTDALVMWHEALIVMERHPSLALLACVSAIEQLAQRTVKLKHCPTCNQYTKATERFTNFIEPYIGEDAALEPAMSAYDQRSRTVHESRTFGSEPMLGHVVLEIPSKELEFERLV